MMSTMAAMSSRIETMSEAMPWMRPSTRSVTSSGSAHEDEGVEQERVEQAQGGNAHARRLLFLFRLRLGEHLVDHLAPLVRVELGLPGELLARLAAQLVEGGRWRAFAYFEEGAADLGAEGQRHEDRRDDEQGPAGPSIEHAGSALMPKGNTETLPQVRAAPHAVSSPDTQESPLRKGA